MCRKLSYQQRYANTPKFLIPTNLTNLLKPPQASFSAKIDELREENENLERELNEWKDQATAESKLQQDSEQE
jgi:hypothetical protein